MAANASVGLRGNPTLQFDVVETLTAILGLMDVPPDRAFASHRVKLTLDDGLAVVVAVSEIAFVVELRRRP